MLTTADSANFNRQSALRRLIIAAGGSLLGVFIGGVSLSLSAQNNGNPPEVTLEKIEEIRGQAAANVELESETKQKIETLCGQAVQNLNRITQLAELANQLKTDSSNVSQRIGEMRRKLSDLRAQQPAPPTLLRLTRLEQEVGQREIDLAELKAERKRSEESRTTRADRRRQIRELLLSASKRVTDLQAEIEAPPTAGEVPLLTQARRAELKTRQMVIHAEQPAWMNELALYDAEDAADLLRWKGDVLAEEIRIASDELQKLKDQLTKQRAADYVAAQRRAEAALEMAPMELRPVAEENLALTVAASELSQPLEARREKLEKATQQLEALQKQFQSTQQRVQDVGLTGSIGALLRRQQADLPDVRKIKRNLQERKKLIEETQYSLFDYEEKRQESAEATVQRIMAGFSEVDDEKKKELEPIARTLAERQREYLNLVIRTHKSYLDTLFELDATEQLIIRQTVQYDEYIDERVFWIRSNPPLWNSFVVEESDSQLLVPEKWNELVRVYWQDIRTRPVIHFLAVLAFFALLWQKPRFRRELESISQKAARGTCTRFAPTMRALFLTLMLSALWPGLIMFAAWRLSTIANGYPFARAAAYALFAVAYVYWPLELLRRICRPRGLADSHFEWAASTIAVIRSSLKWAIPPGLVAVFMTTLLYCSETEHGVDSVERICFVAGMLLLAFFVRRLLKPNTGIFHGYLANHPGGWFDRLKPVWYGAAVTLPLVLAGMTVAGYYYTAHQLSLRLFDTLVFIGAVHILASVCRRMLLMHRRTISIEHSREKRAAETAGTTHAGDPANAASAQILHPEKTKDDVQANAEQGNRLVRMAALSAVFVGAWLIWVDVLPALKFLDEKPVWGSSVASGDSSPGGPAASPLPLPGAAVAADSNSDDSTEAAANESTEILNTVTYADIGLAILIGIVTFVCARNIPGLMEMLVLRRLPLDGSIRYALTSVTSYLIVLLGIILAFNAMSIGWSKVQWLATALTFGLAFGLQEIFANFVAGLILLFERPIRVGDVVTVDEVTGVVSRIRIRATTITNWDRKEYVIPNKEFITGRMLNWTLTDKTNRILINVGVAYGSNVERAKEVLKKTCNDHPLVLDDPPTQVTFEGFGDNSLNLVVRTFLPDLDNRLPVIDELHTAINKAFRQERIEIAFPQRDLHLRSIDARVLEGISSNEDRKAA